MTIIQTILPEQRPREGHASPWGAIQVVKDIAPGIWQVYTASHGGLYLSADRYAAMPAAWRQTAYSRNGWYEEDCDWAFVAVTFPDCFPPEHVAIAERTIASTYPEKGAA